MHKTKPSRPEYGASVGIFVLPIVKGNPLLCIITDSSNSGERKVAEPGSHSTAQVDLQVIAVFLPQVPDYWDYKYMSPQQDARCF